MNPTAALPGSMTWMEIRSSSGSRPPSLKRIGARRLLSTARSVSPCLVLFSQARAFQNVRHRVVAFMTGVLVYVRIGRRPGHFAGPWPLPGIGILYREPVQQRAIAGAREALDHVQVLR